MATETTRLHPALSCVVASILLQLYVHTSFFRSLFQVFLGRHLSPCLPCSAWRCCHHFLLSVTSSHFHLLLLHCCIAIVLRQLWFFWIFLPRCFCWIFCVYDLLKYHKKLSWQTYPYRNYSGVTRRGRGGPPWVTPEGKKLWANLQRIVEKRGRTGKKRSGVKPSRGDTRVKAIKTDSDSDSDEQKRSSGFSGKNRGVTPLVAAPGVTQSDATEEL